MKRRIQTGGQIDDAFEQARLGDYIVQFKIACIFFISDDEKFSEVDTRPSIGAIRTMFIRPETEWQKRRYEQSIDVCWEFNPLISFTFSISRGSSTKTRGLN